MSEDEKVWWKIPAEPNDLEKLDQFAASALNALLANDREFDLSFEKAAELSFEYAYFMMRERRRYK